MDGSWEVGSRPRPSVPQSVSWMSTENTQVGGAWNLEAEGRLKKQTPILPMALFPLFTLLTVGG